jgi:choline dehydrogenase-like flavoprotein
VTLSNEKTRWGLPKTSIVFNRTPDEIANCESRVELLQRVIRAMGYRVTIAQVDRPGGHHATGTCRMAHDPKDGVTDPELRVHGTDNLYVCSNAVMPTGAAVNPTLTLVALAMRLGDHLIRRSGGAPVVPNQSIPATKSLLEAVEVASESPVEPAKPRSSKRRKEKP